MIFPSSLSDKNDLLRLLYWVRTEAYFTLESPFIYLLFSLFRLLAILSGTVTVENKGVSSVNNLELH